MAELFRVENIVKRYAGVTALNDASVTFEKGEIHAIIGENGAGKSTLMKVLSGAISPNSGKIVFNGAEYDKLTPKQSIELGIQVIYQELNLIDNMNVMDNVFVGMPPRRGILVDFKKMESETRKILHRIGMDDIDPKSTISSLTPGYRQMIEIAKALRRNVSVLILDEPTSSLSATESEKLFNIMAELKKDGVTILFISHRLDEIFRIADRVTIMRDGKIISTSDIDQITRSEMINQMVGRDFKEVYPVSNAEKGDICLEVDQISGVGFHDISFKLRKGEILGFAGLVGAGRTETVMGIYGATKLHSGRIFINGKEVNNLTPEKSIQHKIALLPENRKEQGLIISLPIRNNIDLPSLKRISKGIVINEKEDIELADKGIQALSIKTPSRDQVVINLSGGNQQKVVVAKWLGANSDILIFDEPTKGIDVAAKQEIYELLCRLAREGKGIILISSDMEEILGMADRIEVFFEGTIFGEISSRDQFDSHLVMSYASGIRG